MIRVAALVLLLLQAAAPQDPAAKPQEAKAPKEFKQEELDQILAPVALYPDNLLAQVFIASTYPVEIILAQRWYEANKNMKGDALTKALEAQTWDAAVKSLIATPQVLKMMSEKLDWTVKLGDAFLAQQKLCMETVQKLRAKAKDQGNLKTDDKMKVSGEPPTIVIESSNPQVIYVPAYNPTVVYGTWWYPAYPPYYYYPPGYVAGGALWFGAGVTLGLAWGFAWGGCHWGSSDVDIDINRNTEFNRNIDRNRPEHKASTGGANSGKWKHDPSHRQGAPYRDSASQAKYGNRSSKPSAGTSDSFRGRDSGASRPSTGAGSSSRPSASTQPKSTPRADTGSRTGAFNGSGGSGSATRSHSSRGTTSRGGGGGGGRGGGGGGGRR